MDVAAHFSSTLAMRALRAEDGALGVFSSSGVDTSLPAAAQPCNLPIQLAQAGTLVHGRCPACSQLRERARQGLRRCGCDHPKM